MSSATGEVVNFAADYKVRRSKTTAGEGIQHIRLDIGSGSTESLVTSLNPLPVSGSLSISAATASAITTEATINVATSSTSVLASNSSRKGGWVRNISDVDIYVSFSGAATTSKPTRVSPEQSLYLAQWGGIYTGAVSAIHASSGSKSLEVVEL